MEVTELEITERVSKVLGFTKAEFKACGHCGRHVFHVPLGLQEVLLEQSGRLHQLCDAVAAPAEVDLVARIRGVFSLLGIRSKPCGYCPELIWMLPTKKGSLMPVQRDGIPHWGKCPGANLARRPR